jgi:predicted phosphoribosyltransferase/dienelactone hydrolase
MGHLTSDIVRIEPLGLEGTLVVPDGASGIVLFAHGSGSSRFSPRNLQVASVLQDAGLGTLLLDLLMPSEAADRSNVFDITLLAGRLEQAVRWLKARPLTQNLSVGLFGASTGAAAALTAAARLPDEIDAVVSRGGRPDLAFDALHHVRAPTLLIVGGADTEVLALNRRSFALLTCEKEMSIVSRATHLFEEAGALEKVADLAAAWFKRWLVPKRAAFSGRFVDRADAGRRLAEQLSDLKSAKPIIFALPRGGVPVAAEIAKALRAPLDLILVRKIGLPGQPELAIGAVVDGQDPELVINERVLRWEGLTRADAERLSKEQIEEIERRRALYFGTRPRPSAKGRTVVVVDDGMATGATMRVALQALRKRQPKRTIVAVPVASAEAAANLEGIADEVRVLHAPPHFRAVGLHYENFSQTTDQEVVSLLAENAATLASA